MDVCKYCLLPVSTYHVCSEKLISHKTENYCVCRYCNLAVHKKHLVKHVNTCYRKIISIH